MKRPRGGKPKGGRKDEAPAGLGGEEALQLKQAIEAAGGVGALEQGELLRALGVDHACDASHAKGKVRAGGGARAAAPPAAAAYRRTLLARLSRAGTCCVHWHPPSAVLASKLHLVAQLVRPLTRRQAAAPSRRACCPNRMQPPPAAAAAAPHAALPAAHRACHCRPWTAPIPTAWPTWCRLRRGTARRGCGPSRRRWWPPSAPTPPPPPARCAPAAAGPPSALRRLSAGGLHGCALLCRS